MIPIIGIVYDDNNPESYAGVTLRMGSGSLADTFHTGNPTVDYLTAVFVVASRNGVDHPAMSSSSIDHFVMDGGDLNTDNPPEAAISAALDATRRYLESCDGT